MVAIWKNISIVRAQAESLRYASLALEFKEDGGERRQGQQQRVWAILGGDVFRMDTAEIADAGAAVICGIGIEDFLVKAWFRNADAIVAADDGGGVENDNQKIIAIAGASDERDDAAVGVVAINPFEASPFEIHFVKSGFGRVQVI